MHLTAVLLHDWAISSALFFFNPFHNQCRTWLANAFILKFSYIIIIIITHSVISLSCFSHFALIHILFYSLIYINIFHFIWKSFSFHESISAYTSVCKFTDIFFNSVLLHYFISHSCSITLSSFMYLFSFYV